MSKSNHKKVSRKEIKIEDFLEDFDKYLEECLEKFVEGFNCDGEFKDEAGDTVSRSDLVNIFISLSVNGIIYIFEPFPEGRNGDETKNELAKIVLIFLYQKGFLDFKPPEKSVH